ncbi:hypothetical protein, partial [Zoogloea sp.]|uniref:hypothetical protein n=1 Tax=Zoogloea sp. TaxID=49181 RepID=UPI001ACCCCB3
MKKRLIAHIGTHKTGSTSIQKALYDARGALRQAGILFPSTDRGPRPSKHHSINTAAKSGLPEAKDAEYRALMDEFNASGAHTMIVSAEGFSAPTPDVAEFFARFLPDFDLEVVCYLRRQDQFVESLYNQVLRDPDNAERRSISEFWRDERISARLDYHTTLARWRDLPAKVIALDFAREVKQHGLLPSFLQATGLQALGPLPDKVANKSPDMNLVLTLRQLHLHGIDHNHKRLIRAARALDETGDFAFLKQTLGGRERTALLDTFADCNARLAADFGVRFSEDRPKEGTEPIDAPEPRYVMALIALLSLGKGKMEEDEDESPLTPEQLAEKEQMKQVRRQRRADKAERAERKKAGKAEKASPEQKAARKAARA